MKINTSTSSVRGNILRLGSTKLTTSRSGQAFKLIISLIIPQLAGGLGSFFKIGSDPELDKGSFFIRIL